MAKLDFLVWLVSLVGTVCLGVGTGLTIAISLVSVCGLQACSRFGASALICVASGRDGHLPVDVITTPSHAAHKVCIMVTSQALLFVIYESAVPHTAMLGRLPGTHVYRCAAGCTPVDCQSAIASGSLSIPRSLFIIAAV